jgi:uncharacterized protein YgbK (DUF1537 family)
MTILLGCIADDFTGATDLANGCDAENQRQAKFRQASRLKRIPLAPHLNAAFAQPADS